MTVTPLSSVSLGANLASYSGKTSALTVPLQLQGC